MEDQNKKDVQQTELQETKLQENELENKEQEQQDKEQQQESLSLYIAQLGDELQFLWRDAQTVDDKELRERKLTQFWELYRYYRKQKEFFNLI
ncbi:MAG: hypothetical protein ACXVCY_05905 [Pseudobdellovibrionaceae bacterium]